MAPKEYSSLDRFFMRFKDIILITAGIITLLGIVFGFWALPGKVEANTSDIKKLNDWQSKVDIRMAEQSKDTKYILDAVRRIERKVG